MSLKYSFQMLLLALFFECSLKLTTKTEHWQDKTTTMSTKKGNTEQISFHQGVAAKKTYVQMFVFVSSFLSFISMSIY